MPIEDDLLRIFRLFIGLRLMLVISLILQRFYLIADQLPLIALFSIAASLYLLLHLSSTAIQRLFGRFYLPFALVVTTVVILIEQRALQARLGLLDIRTLFPVTSTEIYIQPPIILIATTAFLFVPLVLTSWQYTFRIVLAFTLGTVLVDLAALGVVADRLQVSLIEELIAISFRAMTFLIVGYIVSQLVHVKRQQTAKLEAANRKLMQHTATVEQLSISRERNRLARELHDTLAHTLSGMAVKLNAVDLIWASDPQKGRRMLGEVIQSVGDSLNETRRALRDLRASPLEDMGLLLALEQLATTAAERGGCALTLDLPSKLPDIPFAAEQGLYRVAQEALENTVKHADARSIIIGLRVNPDRIDLLVQDDGQGFDPKTEANGHFGLQGMRERAELLGGALDIRSAPGGGTTVQLRLER
jgi:signal transduction histidine kinase